MVTKMPQCSRCFGTNWIDLGITVNSVLHLNQKDEIVNPDQVLHEYQCGGGVAHTDPNEMKQGCGRVIRATPEEISKEGQI
jgi:hypothetical protein